MRPCSSICNFTGFLKCFAAVFLSKKTHRCINMFKRSKKLYQMEILSCLQPTAAVGQFLKVGNCLVEYIRKKERVVVDITFWELCCNSTDSCQFNPLTNLYVELAALFNFLPFFPSYEDFVSSNNIPLSFGLAVTWLNI